MKYICPYCDYEMPEDEADQTCDEGCPSCKCIIDWSDWIDPDELADEL